MAFSFMARSATGSRQEMFHEVPTVMNLQFFFVPTHGDHSSRFKTK
jgi:hypothetical protein